MKSNMICLFQQERLFAFFSACPVCPPSICRCRLFTRPSGPLADNCLSCPLVVVHSSSSVSFLLVAALNSWLMCYSLPSFPLLVEESCCDLGFFCRSHTYNFLSIRLSTPSTMTNAFSTASIIPTHILRYCLYRRFIVISWGPMSPPL